MSTQRLGEPSRFFVGWSLPLRLQYKTGLFCARAGDSKKKHLFLWAIAFSSGYCHAGATLPQLKDLAVGG
jgi:hypothetical protein